MSEQGTMDAAEFMTPPTGDPETDARLASEGAATKAPAKPAAPAPAANDDETAFIGADDDDEGDENDAQPGAEDGEGEGDENAKPEELEEIEVAGKKHRIPKDLKPLLMMQQDYTRKTQEVAEQRKALESEAARVQAERQHAAQQAEVQRRLIGGYAELANLDKALEEYAKLDWNRLEAEDTLEAGRLHRQWLNLKEQRAGIAYKLGQAEQQIQQERRAAMEAQQRTAKAEFAKRQAEAAKAFQDQFKLKNEDIKALFEYAKEQGYQDEELQNLADHRPLGTLRKAQLWDLHVAKQREKAAAKAPAPDPVKPLAPTPRGATRPASSGLDDRLSAEEWVRRREEQLRKRRR